MSAQRPFTFAGGLNLAGPTLGLKPGEATLLENFENLMLGGYRRYEGYERYDGQPEPSKATYQRLNFTGGTGTAIAVGNLIAGGTSAAGAHVLAVNITSGSFANSNAAGDLVLDRVTGTFSVAETITVGGVVHGTVATLIAPGTDIDADFDAMLILAADSARALIQVVPGSGGILGVAVYAGKAHAFRNSSDGLTAAMYVSSGTGWMIAKSGLTPSGRYEFKVENFKGSASSLALYGVSGVHKAFEWDGTTWTDITTGMTDDRPTHVESHNNYLYLSFRNGSLQNSPVGAPTGVWTPRTGAAEIGIGDEITGLCSLTGGVLAVYGATETFGLYGSSSADWILKRIVTDGGAVAHSARNAPGQTFSLNDLGIMPLQTTQAFGNFEGFSVSQRVQPVLDAHRGMLVDALSIRAKSQYRLIFSDGVCVCATLRGARISGYSMLRFLFSPTCASRGVDSLGKEMLLVGSADGFVYRTDVGMSFDGVAMDAMLRTASDHINAPRQLKHFQNCLFHVSTPRPIKLLVQADYDYELSPADISQYVISDVTFSPNSWDVGNWDQIVWDVGDERAGISYPANRIDGVGLTVSMILYHGQEIRPPFTIESGIFIYTNRGMRR